MSQLPRYQVAVVGAGKIGRMIAWLLGTSGEYQVRLLDQDELTLAELDRQLPGVTTRRVDVSRAGTGFHLDCHQRYCRPL